MAFFLSTSPLVLLISLYTLGQFAESKNDTGCHKSADVIFALDASSSIYGPDFRKQLEFVGTVIRDLRIDPSMVRCGLVTYGDRVREEFGLRTHSTAAAAVRAVASVKQLRGNTRTDLALRRVRQMFAADKRPGVPQIGILITDGQSDYPAATRNESELAHNGEIALFAVGIGSDIDQRELRSIASQEDFRFNVGNFNGLKRIRRVLTEKTCDVEVQNDQPPPPQLLSVEGCADRLADVMFVLDGSGSIWGPDFRRQLRFLGEMVALFQVSETGTRVGVITFGNHPIPQFALDRYSTVAEVQRALKRISQQKGGTNTADALRYVRQTSFTGSRHRVGAIKIAVVITDGQSDHPVSTAREATLIKADGVTVFAIGVGSGVDKTELYSIASQPSDQHVFMVENYAALGSIKQRLMSRACLGNPFNEGSLQPAPSKATKTAETEVTQKAAQEAAIATAQPVFNEGSIKPAASKATTTAQTEVTQKATQKAAIATAQPAFNERSIKPSSSKATITAQTEVNTPSTTHKSAIATLQPTKAMDCASLKPADVMFSIPSSIDDQETREVLRFLESTTKSLGVGDGLIRVGLAPRLCHAISGFSLDEGSRSDKVSRYIEQQSPSGRVEETAAMLRYLRDVSFRSNDTVTSGTETVKIAVVMVDRRSARLTQASLREANRLQQRGVRILVVVVGKRSIAIEEELLQMTGCDSCLLRAESYYSALSALLEPLKRTILTQLCRSSL